MTTTASEKMTASQAENEVLAQGQHGLYVLDGSGDSRFMWSKDNPDEVAAAKKQFEALKEKRYLAYKVNAQGEKGERIDTFDPTAEKIIMAPQLVGG
jgi:hypothetical protein